MVSFLCCLLTEYVNLPTNLRLSFLFLHLNNYHLITTEQPGDTDEILLCDGCDLEIHMSCAGLTSLPSGDWLCDGCLDVLDARKKRYMPEGTRSAEAQLPPLP